MSKRNLQATVHIYIGKNDQDIADWLNMLDRHGINKARWLSALLIAYDKGTTIPIGSVTTRLQTPNTTITEASETESVHSPKRHSASDTMMFGISTYQGGSHKPNKGSRADTNKPLAIHSHLYTTISNKNALKVYKSLKQDGYYVAAVLKYTIRQCLETGEEEVAPNDVIAEQLLAPVALKPLKKPLPLKQAETTVSAQASRVPESTTISENRPINNQNRVKNPLLDFI